MHEINLTVTTKFYGWGDEAEIKLKQTVNKFSGEVEFSDGIDGRHADVRCDSEETAVAALTDFLTDFYCVNAKRGYLADKIKLPMISDLSKDALIHTLIAFDRDRDEETVRDELSLSKSFSVDGFYNFRLRTIERRWNEIIGLTFENFALMYDENALDLLIRFLLSTVAPRFDTVSLCENNGLYEIETSSGENIVAGDAKKLLTALIDIAPMEIILRGELPDSTLEKRIADMFEVKGERKCLSFSENI